MKCSSCGFENNEGANFCAQCNNSFNDTSSDASAPEQDTSTPEQDASPDASTHDASSDTPEQDASTSVQDTDASSPMSAQAASTAPAYASSPTSPSAPTYTTSPASPPASSYAQSAQTPTPTATQASPYPSSYPTAQSYSSTPVRSASPYPYQQPYYGYQSREKQPFTITDAYIIIGFVLAIVGIFSYAFILLPTSIAFSVVGFVKRTNARTLGLSIAGIVVGVVACLIKVGMVLNELGVIPDWLSAGIF